jgi:hypothetical protein
MLSNRVALVALVIACLGAAAAGGYLASRQNVASTPEAALAVATPVGSVTPVQETEAVVSDTSRKVASPAAPDAKAPAKAKDTAAARTSAVPVPKAPSATPRNAELPTLERTWPSGAAANAPVAQNPNNSTNAPVPEPAVQTPRPDDRGIPEVARAPEPPQRDFEELVVPSDSVIGLQADSPVSSERARIEDRVEARVTRDVRVHDQVAIPAGTRALGSVTQVERGGKFKERARLGIRFHTLVLGDGTRLPIQTETIYRYGDAPGNESASKIGGGAAIGAIIGAIIGGGKGAAIGATTGAGAGTAAVMGSERSSATVRPGEPITVRITSPVTVTVEQK